MSDRILFVDDDQMLLSSIERCLGLRFDIETALSGPEALRLIEGNKQYPVIVTDMRMPVMDGVEFICRARELSPNSVYLMLTGNQDLGTAARAVNEGHVSQLLNKPCDPDEIARAVDEALREFDVQRYEREVVQGTFEGAIAIAGDVISILRPEWANRVARAERVLERLRTDLVLVASRNFILATKLAPLGFALLPADEFERYAASRAGEAEHEELTIKAFRSAAQIVGRLPKLAEVSEMLRSAPESDGSFTESGDGDASEQVLQGAALIRAAYLIDSLVESGQGFDDAIALLTEVMTGASTSFVQALREAYTGGAAVDGVSISLDDLVPGLVLIEDLRSRSGERLISAGRHLTAAHIEKLRRDDGVVAGDLLVTRASFEASHSGAGV